MRLDVGGISEFADRSDVRLYASGSAALADGLRWLTEKHRAEGAGEVLLPAYGCPAIVAAALHAGLKPVLLDLAPSSPFPSPSSVAASVSASTAACLHVNFLGLPPPQPAAPPGGEHHRTIAHIYDCCQGWPADARCPPWADACVVSFGRGKPITIGGGGALLLNERAMNSALLERLPLSSSRSAVAFLLRGVLYNAALWPRLFFWIDRAPGLRVGETRFEPLQSVEGMCVHACKRLASNIEAYGARSGWTVGKVREVVGERSSGAFRFLGEMSECGDDVRLLRLPLLADSKERRDLALGALRSDGFGASGMYLRPLWTFSGLEFLRPFAERCTNAADFGDRLLTLPVHDGVSAQMLERMMRRLESLGRVRRMRLSRLNRFSRSVR
jgi:dTDP-4-amino-4,6-dideoxygalactose transaminase